MSRMKAAVVAAMLATTALLAPAAPAQAYDGGDNAPACNQYEICFRTSSAQDWNLNGDFSRDFYWSDMHHDATYFEYDPEPWKIRPAILLMDNADGFWNRDSTCDVKLWDVDQYGTWWVYYDLYRGFRGDVGLYRNNGHSRC